MAVKTLDEKVDQILIDLASVKTDISWLKKLFATVMIPIIIAVGITVESGVI